MESVEQAKLVSTKCNSTCGRSTNFIWHLRTVIVATTLPKNSTIHLRRQNIRHKSGLFLETASYPLFLVKSVRFMRKVRRQSHSFMLMISRIFNRSQGKRCQWGLNSMFVFRYLHYLDKNWTAYTEYFKWRTDYYLANPMSYCHLCKQLQKHKSKIYNNIEEWWHGGNDCSV